LKPVSLPLERELRPKRPFFAVPPFTRSGEDLMKLSMRWLGLSLVALLAACPGERPDDVVITDDPAAPAPEVGPETAPPAEQMMTQRAAVREVQGSGVSGEVTIADRGDRTEISVRLADAPANSTLPGHVHSGTCENIGGVQQALEQITTDATGAGTMTATVDLAPMTAMDGQHVVVYHGEGGTPIACAEIPAHMM
jgi:hypothetical protein